LVVFCFFPTPCYNSPKYYVIFAAKVGYRFRNQRDCNFSNWKRNCFARADSGGDQTPSNFTLTVNPLAKSFSEGTGFDVIEYRDLDSVNWLTSSKNGNSFITWSVSGANASGSIGDSNIDFYTNFEKQVSFDTGQEDLYTEITPTRFRKRTQRRRPSSSPPP
jgi:hypothetical protein